MSVLIWIFVEHLPPPGALQITHLAATRGHFSFFFFFFTKPAGLGSLGQSEKAELKGTLKLAVWLFSMPFTVQGAITFPSIAPKTDSSSSTFHTSHSRFFLRTCQLKRGFKNHNNLKIGVFPLPSMCFIPIPTLSSLKTQQWSRDHLLGPWFLKASLHLGVTVGWPSWTDTTL